MSAFASNRTNPDKELTQEALLEENRMLKAFLAQLRDEVSELKRLIYGSKREHFVPAVDERQLSLEMETEATEESALVKQTVRVERLTCDLSAD